MKFRRAYIFKLLFLAIASVLAVFLAHLQLNSYEDTSRGVLFVSLGLDQELLAGESSSYDILRATEHFADVVLGWVIEPSFERELEMNLGYEVDLKAYRQEKHNMIFELKAASEDLNESSSEVFLKLLNSRLDSYVSATNSGYVFAFTKFTILSVELQPLRAYGAAIVLACLMSGFLFFLISHGFKARR